MRVKKRASKRLGTKQREKVKRKVREHHRKSKREAKKDVTWKSKKRQDPGIPNSFPYKEQLLNEIEQRRAQAEQQRLAAKEERLNGTKKAEEDEDDDMENDEDDEEFVDAQVSSTNVTALPIQFDGSFKEFLSTTLSPESDPHVRLTVMLLDARDPISWRVEQVEELVEKSGCPIVFALSRSDLVPREQVSAWSAHLSQINPVFAVCSPAPAKNGIAARQGGGIAGLVEYIEEIIAKKPTTKKGKKQTNADAAPAVALVGVENSGRTCLANILAASLPDVTILDTPGILPATSKLAHPEDEDEEDMDEDEEETDESLQKRDREAAHRILIRNAGSIFKVREPMPLIDAMMERVAHSSDLMMNYNTPAFVDTNDFLVGVARSAGRLKKGAMPDTLAAARTVLHQWSTGLVGYYAKAPPAAELKDPEAFKSRQEAAKQAIEQDSDLSKLVLPRKEWRQKWNGKEVRLNNTESGMMGTAKVAFTQIQKVEDEEEEEEEVDEELDEDEEDDEDVEFDEDEEEEDDEDDEEDEDEEE